MVDAEMRMWDDNGNLSIQLQVLQGTERDLFQSSADAQNYILERYDQTPGWGVTGTSEINPFKTVTLSKSARVTQGGEVVSVTDDLGNGFGVGWRDGKYLIEGVVDMPAPPDGSDVEQQVSISWIAPQGWTVNAQATNGGVVSQSGVAWYGKTGRGVFGVILTPPLPPALGEPVSVEPEAAAEEESPAPNAEESAGSSSSPAPQPEDNLENPGGQSDAGSSEAPSPTDSAGTNNTEDDSSLVNQIGLTVNELSSVAGLIEINSQFYAAVSNDAEVIPIGTAVRVVGVSDQTLVVESIAPVVEGGSFIATANVGWIIGGSVAGLAAIGAAIFALTRRRKQSPDAEPEEATAP